MYRQGIERKMPIYTPPPEAVRNFGYSPEQIAKIPPPRVINTARHIEAKWDGSYLGVYRQGDITPSSVIIQGVCQVTLTLKTEYAQITGIMKRMASVFTCIADELKPVFHLPKIGTHHLHIGSVRYVLMRPYIPYIRLSELESANAILHSVAFIHRVQETFSFLEALGICCPFESHLLLTNHEGKAHTLSYRDVSTVAAKGKFVLPMTIIRCWFSSDRSAITAAMRRLAGIPAFPDEEAITERLFHLRAAIHEVITRIDNDHVWLTAFIIERIRSTV